MKSIRDSKKLYWGLIITFFVLYALVGFVSTIHSITFFQLANSLWMAVLLGFTYEIGQASVLFSILMTKNRQKILPWALMILLTGLQVTANVYASFKFMDSSGSTDWTYWQRSILFWMEADGPEMFKVVISWITGALLPIVALGMTALVAENLKLKDEEDELKAKEKDLTPPPLPGSEGDITLKEKVKSKNSMDEYIEEMGKNTKPGDFNDISKHIDDTIQEDLKKIREQKIDSSKVESVVAPIKTKQLETLKNKIIENTVKEESLNEKNTTIGEGGITVEKPHIEINLDQKPQNPFEKVQPLQMELSEEEKNLLIKGKINTEFEKLIPEIKHVDEIDQTFDKKDSIIGDFDKDPAIGSFEKKPINNQRGWHLKKEFIDTNGDVYHFGQLQEKDKKVDDSEPLKKAQG